MRTDRSVEYIFQASLLDKIGQTEFEYHSFPTRDLGSAYRENYWDTVLEIRRIYVPGFSVFEEDIFLEGVEWVKSNLGRLTAKFQVPDLQQNSPQPVLLNPCSLFVPAYFDPTMGLRKEECQVNVAFSSEAQDFNTDIRRLTLDHFKRLRAYPFECIPDQFTIGFSTTACLRTLAEFFQSGGVSNRLKATDILSAELVRHYYLGLRRSAIAMCVKESRE